MVETCEEDKCECIEALHHMDIDSCCCNSSIAKVSHCKASFKAGYHVRQNEKHLTKWEEAYEAEIGRLYDQFEQKDAKIEQLENRIKELEELLTVKERVKEFDLVRKDDVFRDLKRVKIEMDEKDAEIDRLKDEAIKYHHYWVDCINKKDDMELAKDTEIERLKKELSKHTMHKTEHSESVNPIPNLRLMCACGDEIKCEPVWKSGELIDDLTKRFVNSEKEKVKKLREKMCSCDEETKCWECKQIDEAFGQSIEKEEDIQKTSPAQTGVYRKKINVMKCEHCKGIVDVTLSGDFQKARAQNMALQSSCNALRLDALNVRKQAFGQIEALNVAIKKLLNLMTPEQRSKANEEIKLLRGKVKENKL